VDRHMDWKHLLAYITGTVDQELLLRNAYLVTENRILRNQLQDRVRLSDGERQSLAELGKKLGRQALEEIATSVKPDTILAWHRKLIAQKFDGSQQRNAPGRPPIDAALEALVVRLAQENRSWGDDRIVGALQHLGYTISDQTVGNILKRQGIPPAPERKKTTTWKEFIRTHMEVLAATDFFTSEVWTWGGLVTYYVLFFLRLRTREVHIAGLTPHPDQRWMAQIARNITMADWGFLQPGQYLIHGGAAGAVAAAEPRFKRLRSALGAFRQGGSPVTTHPVWGARPQACAHSVCDPCSPGAPAPGPKQCGPPACGRSEAAAHWSYSLSWTARRPPQILPP
jgi:putative transposase